MNLWPHQEKAIQLAGQEFTRGHKSVCIVMATGSGKSKTGSALVQRHLAKKPDGKVLWMCHREELLFQAYAELKSWDLDVGINTASKPPEAGMVNPHRPVQVASVQTLVSRGINMVPSMIVADECFVAGTLVDSKAIDSYRVGELVRCFDHTFHRVVLRPITAIMRKRPKSLIRVAGVVCTPDHPFYVVGEGYVEAKRLAGKCIVRYVWETKPTIPQNMQLRMSVCQTFSNDDSHERLSRSTRISSETNAWGAEPYAGPGGTRQSDCDITPYRTQTSESGRERKTFTCSSAETSRAIHRCYTGIYCAHSFGTRVWASDTLQNRHSIAHHRTGDRGRWWLAPYEDSEGTGSQERGFLEVTRVDSVEILESGSDGTFGGVCPDGYVYNLEVGEHHNYFAEGWLVHNCHHFASDKWQELVMPFRKQGIPIIGLTATPIRQDGRGFKGLMDALVCPITMKELITQGFLTPYELVAPPSPLKNDQIAQKPVDAYLQHAAGRKAIVFAKNIKAAKEYADQFNAVNIKSAAIWGDMPGSERREVLNRYKNNEIHVLSNVGVLTEGFDDRSVGCVILARSFGGVSLYLQCVGRALRISPGKSDAVVIDLHGSCHIHGEPNADREWTLEGEEHRRKVLEQPTERFCLVCKVLLDADSGNVCDLCGFARPEAVPPDVMNVKLVKYAAKLKESPEKRRVYFEKLKAIAREKNYSKWQPHAKYKAIYNEVPPRAWW